MYFVTELHKPFVSGIRSLRQNRPGTSNINDKLTKHEQIFLFPRGVEYGFLVSYMERLARGFPNLDPEVIKVYQTGSLIDISIWRD